MRSLARCLHFILIFQLLWGCQASGGGSPISTKKTSGGTPAGGAASNSTSMEIEGVISSVMRNFSLFEEAHAAEGDVNIYDISDMSAPVLLEKLSISGTNTFNVKLENTLKLIKIEFVAKDAVSSRNYLMNVNQGSDKVTIDVNEENHFKASIIERQLELELANNLLAPEEIHSRFERILSEEIEGTLSTLGNREMVVNLLKDPSYRSDTVEILANLKLGNPDMPAKLLALAQVAYQSNGKIALYCDSKTPQVFLSDKNYKLIFRPLSQEVLEAFGQEMGYGFSNSDEGSILLQDLQKKLSIVSDDHQMNLSASITVTDGTETADCVLHGKSPEDGFPESPNPL